eukprot:CAMPEP_0178435058 /NCGR_PEP_ID=MMETSP0689_2-20121128/33735_1 /TAXON_ID=160604 /ORGANISM="Amphidinium massartii, Strain CS-259" /LENGTH=433 /DNA_ID=CAMNT_0020057125 /DNA_START=40 /DNA_END=1341 /DNA_ORIENTATION=+
MVARRTNSTFALAAGAAVCLLSAQQYFAAFVTGHRAVLSRDASLVARQAAVDPELKARIGACKKTSKVTDAMRVVAAARVRQAQDALTASRPFSEELQGMIKGLVKKLEGSGLEADLPLLRTSEVKNVAIVVILSDKGLCGGYNSQTIQRLRARVEDLNKENIYPEIIAVGRKANVMVSRLAQRGFMNGEAYKWNEKIIEMGKKPDAALASKVGERTKDLFISGEVDKVEVVYNKFVNLIKSDPAVRTILPLSPTNIQDPEDETFKLTSEEGRLSVEKEKSKSVPAKEIEPDVIFDQEPQDILNSMLPLYLNSQLLGLLYEGQTSELACRMNAMKSATDNANDRAAELTLIMNRKRQASITQELLEINAAGMALEASDDDAVGPYSPTEETVTKELLSELGLEPPAKEAPQAPSPRDMWKLRMEAAMEVEKSS